MKTIRLSREAVCAQEQHVFKPAWSAENKRAWINANDLHVCAEGRAYALVASGAESCYMDCITGSLYQGGQCLSSSHLTAVGIKRNQAGAARALMGVKTQEPVR